MIDATAIIVTRGDVDLGPTLEPLSEFAETIIWDNSTKVEDAKCFGRFLATEEARMQDVFFVDDDVVFSRVRELWAQYLANGREITANMSPDWVTAGGYEDLCLFGAGSFMGAEAWKPAVHHYLTIYPYDDDFLTYVDPIVGLLAPHHVTDLGFEVLPWAVADNRIARAPGQKQRKQMMLERGRALRDQ